MLSIIIPAHNEQEYIAETIKSIRNQKFTSYEIITVLDGCTDNTLNQVRNKVDKIVVIRNRKGPGVAKNEGAKRAKGEVLVFLDADTKITENILQEIEGHAKRGYYGTCKIKPSNKKLKHKIFMGLKNYYPLPFTNGILFCSKAIFESAGGFPQVHKGEDGKLARRLKKYAKFKKINAYVISSTRRFEKKGYAKVILYWIREYIKPTKEQYDVIR